MDEALKEFLQKPEMFADLTNAVLYGGKGVLKPESLKEMDSVYTKNNIKRIRDIYKKCIYKTDGQQDYLLVGIENQSYVNYEMVIRTLLYDALSYDMQAEEKGEGRAYGKLTEKDKLKPVITIMVYYGRKWTGARCLYEIINCREELKKYITNYKMNLIEVQGLSEEELKLYKSEVRTLFEFVKESKSKKRLSKLLETNQEYQHVSKACFNAIKSVTKIEMEQKEEGEEVNMCRAFNELKMDWEKKGLAIGRVEGASNRNTEIATTMLKDGVSIDLISRYTGLSMEQIDDLTKDCVE